MRRSADEWVKLFFEALIEHTTCIYELNIHICSILTNKFFSSRTATLTPKHPWKIFMCRSDRPNPFLQILQVGLRLRVHLVRPILPYTCSCTKHDAEAD